MKTNKTCKVLKIPVDGKPEIITLTENEILELHKLSESQYKMLRSYEEKLLILSSKNGRDAKANRCILNKDGSISKPLFGDILIAYTPNGEVRYMRNFPKEKIAICEAYFKSLPKLITDCEKYKNSPDCFIQMVINAII